MEQPHETSIELIDGVDAQPQQRLLDLATEDSEHLVDAVLPRSKKRIQIAPPDADRASPECECLDDVAAPTNSAVDQHLQLVANCVDNPRQCLDCRDSAVEHTTAVVRDHDGVDSLIDRSAGR